MHSLFTSTAYRVAMVYSAAFALLMAMLGVFVYFAFHAALVHQLDAAVTNESAELVSEYEKEGLAALTRAITEREQAGTADDLGYALFDADGRRIAGRLDTPLPPAGTREIVFNDPEEGPDPARAEVRRLQNGGTLVVAADREPIERTNETMLSVLFGALGAILFIGIAGGLLLGAYLRARLGRISSAAEGIMAGDLNQRIVVSPRNDEFDRLAQTLNEMLDRIGALLANLEQVSSDIAHDLRTPLSRLRSRLERILADSGDDAHRRRAIEDTLGSVDELLELFSAILRISEVESGEPRRAFRRFDLSALIDEICQSYAPAIEDNGRSLGWNIAAGVELDGDRELLAQGLINLIENAQKHTPPGTVIEVSLETRDQAIHVGVADNGPGVKPEDRARISGRFTRVESARTTPGHGLGLNLVSAVAALHYGKLIFDDNSPGLVATLVLPKSA